MERMKFKLEHSFGNARYYPVNESAHKLVKLFSHSAGERKILTEKQYLELKEIGIEIIVE